MDDANDRQEELNDRDEEESVQVSDVQKKKGQKNFHPFSLFPLNLTDEEWLDHCTAWLVDEATTTFAFCRTKSNTASLKCQCFSALVNEEYAKAVAEYLWFFGKSTPAEKDRITMDSIRFQHDTPPPKHLENH